jgi:prepilin-type N-terminal cleavage/methylation domain-containing protein
MISRDKFIPMKPKTFNPTTSRPPRGFTLVELLVVITIIVVLAGVGYPAMSKMRASADQTKCMEQLREWGVILGTYASENDGKVEWSRWEPIGVDPAKTSVYLPYMTSADVDVTTKSDGGSYDKLLKMRNCPTTKWDKAKTNGPVTYAMIRPQPRLDSSLGGNYTFLSKIANPSRFILMTESLASAAGTLETGGDFTTHVQPLTVKGANLRHTNASVNSLMGDFSLRTMTWKDLQKGLSYWTAYEPAAGGGR